MPTPPTIDYGRPEPLGRFPRWLLVLLIAGATVALLLSVGQIFPVHRTGTHPQVRCAANLRQIGQAVMLYAQDNGFAYPPDFQALVITENISAEVFVCRLTSDTKAPPNTPLSKPGHCSYIYTGASLNSRSHYDCVVAIEDPGNHNMEGTNVLFADGRVDRLDMPAVMHLLNELNVGHNPPYPTTGPSTPEGSARKDYNQNWKGRMPQLKSSPWVLPATQPAGR